MERIAIFESKDGITWQKQNKHFEDVLEDLLQGKKVRCNNWPEGDYLDIWHGCVMINNNGSSWRWNPSVDALKSEWTVIKDDNEVAE